MANDKGDKGNQNQPRKQGGQGNQNQPGQQQRKKTDDAGQGQQDSGQGMETGNE